MGNDLGRLILRVTLGVLVLLYGFHKVKYGLGHIPHTLNSYGLPPFLSYGVYISEVIAPLMVIIGLYTRPAAGVIAFSMLLAIFFVHTSRLTALNSSGGSVIGIEYMFLAAALCIMMIGAGRFSLNSPYN
ncbi:MAG: DoxX family protein [Alcaligenaceae bacterium]|jgi:putative oxidoreductase|nr:DoxX family protein [Alcaligenaceae bacterium]